MGVSLIALCARFDTGCTCTAVIVTFLKCCEHAGLSNVETIVHSKYVAIASNSLKNNILHVTFYVALVINSSNKNNDGLHYRLHLTCTLPHMSNILQTMLFFLHQFLFAF